MAEYLDLHLPRGWRPVKPDVTSDMMLHPFVDIEVGGVKNTITVQALDDTGFTGDLCILVPLAVNFGLQLMG